MIKLYKNLSLNNISIFLLILFPLCLVTGPLLSEIFMNLISIIFLLKIYKKKDTKLFSETFFLFFIFFYFIVLLSVFFSIYSEIILFKNIFYFRYIFFVFAIAYILKENKNLNLIIYKYLSVIFLLLSIDGLVQFFLDYNILGNMKIRPDRVSGLFGEKMVLGSYLSRITPLLVGLFLYNVKFLNKNEKIYGIFVIFISFIGILISGERMPLISIIFFFISLLIFLNINKKIKIIFFSIISATFGLALLLSPTLFDRHIKQTIDQVNFNFDDKSFFSNFQFYERTYTTAFNGFLDKKIIGQGAKSFRHFCKEKKFIDKLQPKNISENLGSFLDETFVYINDVYFKKGDVVRRDDKIFNYTVDGEKKTFTIGLLLPSTSINDVNFPRKFYITKLRLPLRTEQAFENPIDLRNIRLHYNYTLTGCTTHPHNFYLQLLGETGLAGFIILLSLFIYLTFLILKNFINSFFNKRILTNFQITLLIGFIMTLLPLIPNGNFFNNWISMILFYPVGFYISTLNNIKK